MKTKVLLSIIALFFSFNAQSETFNVTVLCQTSGPTYQGTLTVPDEWAHGKCVNSTYSDRRGNPLFMLIGVPLNLSLDFNGLNYVASSTKGLFSDSSCTDFAGGRGTAYEESSGRRSTLDLSVLDSKYFGTLDNCSFKSK